MMDHPFVYPAQVGTQSLGQIRVNLTTSGEFRPVEDATVQISSTSDPDTVIEETRTDENGQTQAIEVPTPDLENSMEPESGQPYSEYNITVIAPGFERLLVSGVQVFPQVTALQESRLNAAPEPAERDIAIPPHTLYGDFPPQIAEDEIKTVAETGEIVLSEVVVPETVIVHDGTPNDTTANNYYVSYRDYIKNVASSEIYATWSESTIIANILAIMSFTLNRVYTEWYRGKGYNFTITSSTAYDQFFVYGRNIHTNISTLVDTIFSNYLTRPNIAQPVLTQYCDGQTVTCPNWLSQWGSKELGEQGYEAIEIIHNYYGSDMYIETAKQVSGIPSSFPGTNLTIGSRGDSVRQMQQQLNRISDNFPAIPKVADDGIFGNATAESVKTFQEVFGLPANGIVDYPTWYKISAIYVAVSRIAELV